MHPNKFFSEVACKTGIDIVEIFDNNLKEELKNLHPKNFLKTKILLPVYKITVSYFTSKGNYKESAKYLVADSEQDEEYIDFWIDIFVNDFKSNKGEQIYDVQILSVKKICEAVLPIG